ncbi:DMT family transporter [Paenirhodobacter enshiensis]|uniref:DMT family transporter n=1 Tax=Paenirhodobacter enshiensis TaxID=1105367 RepID=UPI0035B22556
MPGPRLAAALTAILWGFTYLVTTDMLPPHPTQAAALRALGGGAFLLAIGREALPRTWLWRLFVLGTLNTGIFFVLFFIGAMRLPSGVAAIFQALGPIATLLFAWALLHRRPSGAQFASLILGAAGVTLVVLKSSAALDPIGVAAALGSMVALTLSGILMNMWGRPPIGFSAFFGWQLMIGGIELAILTALNGDYGGTADAMTLGAFALLAVVLTGVPFLLWFRAISMIGAVNVMPFILLTPVTALVIDAVVKSVVPTPLQMLGIVVVIAALLLNYRASQPKA